MSYEKAVASCSGKTIRTAALTDDDYVVVEFEDGSKLRIWDDGQSCCEHRYITCDEDLSSLAGQAFLEIEEREAPQPEQPKYECHDTMFVAIKTDKSEVVLCTHNEHNGYYGGFSVSAKVLQ